MTKKFNLYLGKAGHLAVMSEFLMRGWNVAIPEVDVGDDIFVVQDNDGTLRRVQVKSSSAAIRRKGFSCQFNVPLTQLKKIGRNKIYYVFVVRSNEGWSKPLIIAQDILLDLQQNNHIGSISGKNINLYFSYRGDQIICSGQDLSRFECDYTDFPIIQH